MLRVYDVSLRWVLRHRPVMMASFLAVLGVTSYLYTCGQQGLHSGIPITTISTFRSEAAQGTSYYQMVKFMFRQIARIVVQDPDVETFQYEHRQGAWVAGVTGGSGNTGQDS